MSTPASLLPFGNAPEPPPPGEPAWRSEIQARLRDHRQRRADIPDAPREERRENGEPREKSRDAAARVAARVAERYRNAPTYQEVLAESAARAAQAAENAAEAALEAHAAAQAVLEELRDAQDAQDAARSYPRPQEPFFTESAQYEEKYEAEQHVYEPVPVSVSVSVVEAHAAPEPVYTAEHHQPLPERVTPPARPVTGRARALVDAFAEAIVPAAQALPAKLIEFPRELIATRKQRPRLAEGPLLDENGPGLRIFEVAEESAYAVSAVAVEAAETHPSMTQQSLWDAPGRVEAEEPPRYEPSPVRPAQQREAAVGNGKRRAGFDWGESQASNGWGAIRLGEHPVSETDSQPAPATARRAQYGYKQEALPSLNDLASVSDRFMAAIVDAALVGGSFLLFLMAFAATAPHIPMGKGIVAFGIVVLLALGALYGWLFMSFGGGSTPGMRYARIALCTFRDENPTRRELQSRVLSTALALLPLGLGFIWAFLDEDRLGWQDRMTRTYQRSYR